jgi:hypothetical protein
MVLGPQGGTFSGAAAAAGEEGAAAAAGRRTGESVSAADSIMDALDVAAHEADKQQEHAAAVAIAKVRKAAHKWTRASAAFGMLLVVITQQPLQRHPHDGSLWPELSNVSCSAVLQYCSYAGRASHSLLRVIVSKSTLLHSQAAKQPLPKPPPSNPLMLGLSPEAYVLRTVSSVRANDLEQALLLLPFADALKLLQWAAAWLAQGNQVGVGGMAQPLPWPWSCTQLCIVFATRLSCDH